MTFQQFESLSLYILVGGLIVFMGFIVWDLAKQSKAGRFGTAVLFIALFLGVVGFVVKTVLVEVFNIGGG